MKKENFYGKKYDVCVKGLVFMVCFVVFRVTMMYFT